MQGHTVEQYNSSARNVYLPLCEEMMQSYSRNWLWALGSRGLFESCRVPRAGL